MNIGYRLFDYELACEPIDNRQYSIVNILHGQLRYKYQ